MDKIDKKLITLLQENARMPLKALAENVFSFFSAAVSARIERLEKEQIIQGYEVKSKSIKIRISYYSFYQFGSSTCSKTRILSFYYLLSECRGV